jgi:hypothetical protein
LLDEGSDELGLGKLVDLAIERANKKPKTEGVQNDSGDSIPHIKIRKTGNGI